MTGLLWAGRATLTDPASRIPAEKFALLNRAALNACDAQDGVTDGVIESPAAAASIRRWCCARTATVLTA